MSCSQNTANRPYMEPDGSTECHHTYLLISHIVFQLLLLLGVIITIIIIIAKAIVNDNAVNKQCDKKRRLQC